MMNSGNKFQFRIVAFLVLFAGFVGTVGAWELQWYGQAGFRISTPGGKTILIDPFITRNPKLPAKHKDLKKLGKVDLILITHGHGDHVADAPAIAGMTGAKIALNADLGHTLGTLGLVPYKQIIRFNKSGPIQPLEGITITMVRAEHSSEYLHQDPDTGKKQMYPGGEPAGFIIKLENGYKIYHAGDTGVFADMKFIGEYYRPDLSLLPIGGNFTMDPVHAAYAIKSLLKTKHVIPMHYGTHALLTGTPEQLNKALGRTATKVTVMQPGETLRF
jgi:L-ascorbate metabolism protein UlaG (beta-lactamase superfamily)